ncbi:hypothetical protein GCM10022402_45190 [Salinactinospora qingdaonensis]|uniref:Uncharacterized protein n=1 Tax=Salinactinospora qingdaonensis TaxID=702744 RepID=A0ABP7GFG7_9ACTN
MGIAIPERAVEITSKGNAAEDRGEKREGDARGRSPSTCSRRCVGLLRSHSDAVL